MDKNYLIPYDTLVERLSKMYHTDCLATAKCCDEVLDRSGALLGKVRSHHSKTYGTIDAHPKKKANA